MLAAWQGFVSEGGAGACVLPLWCSRGTGEKLEGLLETLLVESRDSSRVALGELEPRCKAAPDLCGRCAASSSGYVALRPGSLADHVRDPRALAVPMGSLELLRIIQEFCESLRITLAFSNFLGGFWLRAALVGPVNLPRKSLAFCVVGASVCAERASRRRCGSRTITPTITRRM